MHRALTRNEVDALLRADGRTAGCLGQFGPETSAQTLAIVFLQRRVQDALYVFHQLMVLPENRADVADLTGFNWDDIHDVDEALLDHPTFGTDCRDFVHAVLEVQPEHPFPVRAHARPIWCR
jgi:hypothetical protein